MANTLTDLQLAARALLANVRHPRVASALALAEEAGEVCQEVMTREVYAQPPNDPTNLSRELADVLLCLMELADHYNINLEQALGDRLAELSAKVPGWEQRLGPVLAARRQAWDQTPSPD